MIILSMKNDDPQFKIRLPEKLKEQIASFAKKNKRSINAEILDLLEKASNLNDANDILNNAAIKKVVSLVTNRATKLVERELALKSLTKSEQELLAKLDELPKQKREAIIEILTSLIKVV
jgi:hypothetical protein